MRYTPLHYQTILEVGSRLQAKELSPVELPQTILDRIDALDGDLQSYATVMTASALASGGGAGNRRRTISGRSPWGADSGQGLVFHHRGCHHGRRQGPAGLRS